MKLLIFPLIFLPALLPAQNSAVRWSCFDMGFARSDAAGWETRCAVGQGFSAATSYGNTRVESGFLASLALRGPVVAVSEPDPFPVEVALSQNYPNPFNPTTSIRFRVPGSTVVTLKVFDVLGREVATLLNEEKSAGVYTVRWDASGISSGVYFCRLQTATATQTRRMVLVR